MGMHVGLGMTMNMFLDTITYCCETQTVMRLSFRSVDTPGVHVVVSYMLYLSV